MSTKSVWWAVGLISLREFILDICFYHLYTAGSNVLETPNRRTDRQIDRLVYELYGLTEEEISIIEEG